MLRKIDWIPHNGESRIKRRWLWEAQRLSLSHLIIGIGQLDFNPQIGKELCLSSVLRYLG